MAIYRIIPGRDLDAAYLRQINRHVRRVSHLQRWGYLAHDIVNLMRCFPNMADVDYLPSIAGLCSGRFSSIGNHGSWQHIQTWA